MIAVRGLYTPWLVSRALKCSFFDYMSGIYVRPLLTAIPALALAWGLQLTILPGHNWAELIAAAALTAACYLSMAMFVCIAPHHRALFVGRIPMLGRRFATDRA